MIYSVPLNTETKDSKRSDHTATVWLLSTGLRHSHETIENTPQMVLLCLYQNQSTSFSELVSVSLKIDISI